MTLSSYPAYKASVISLLDKVPIEWELKRLGDLVEFAQGKAHEPYVDVDGEFICVNSRFVSTQGATIKYCNLNLTPAAIDDVLMVMSDLPNGRALARAYYVVDDRKYAVNQRVCRIRPFIANSRFLFYLLDRHPVLLRKDDGFNQTHLSNSDFQKLNLYLPSQYEQTHIARFLDHETAKIDTLIERQQQLIQLLREKRQAVISHAVTKGLNPNAKMHDSGVEWLGEVPEHWSLVQLRYMCSFFGGGTPSKENPDFWGGNIPWVSPKDMKTDYILTAQDKITRNAVLQSAAKMIKAGAVLIVVRGMILDHSVPVALSRSDLTINQDMKALVPDSRIDGEYLLYCLKGMRDIILNLVESSAHGTKCLRTDQFERLEIPLPSLQEQREIVKGVKAKLVAFDDLIAKAGLAIELASERRTALISAAVTGKIDVRDWVPPASDHRSEEAA